MLFLCNQYVAPHTNLWVCLNWYFNIRQDSPRHARGRHGLIGSIAFSVSGRNREMAIPLSARKRSQRSRLYYCRTMSLIHCIFIAKRTPSKRDFGFLPFFWKGKKSWESCRSWSKIKRTIIRLSPFSFRLQCSNRLWRHHAHRLCFRRTRPVM